MEKFGVNQLRRMYLEFFESKGHLAMKSFSLVPHNDDSLLLINAGMAPLKPYFTGQEIPPRRRVTTCQKCVRTGDIENVGKTARHLTFFEMLGNFSFGDYFKREAIHWSWEFLTTVLMMEPERLYPTIYIDDEEAYEIWTKEVGVPADHVYRFGRDPETGASDNFWEHGSGPCGPCSEIYYDRGEKYGTGPEDVMGGEGDRFMEIWNNVFTQFNNDGHGNYTELAQKNIDTGMGLERLAVVMQDVNSVFEIDTMKAIRDEVCRLSGKRYEENREDDISIRLITDHIRSTTFMICDDIMPSNEGRGYVLRRLIRRASRHGRMLGISGEFMAKLADVVIRESKDGYPELAERQEFIRRILTEEEHKFNATIDQGLSMLSDMEAALEAKGEKVLSGLDAFRLYDTYGFPIDLTGEILAEKGMTYDKEAFAAAMEEQRAKARGARKASNYMGKDASVYDDIDNAISSEFVGYDKLSYASTIRVLTSEVNPREGKYGELRETLENGKGTIIVDQTPFYGTMGGQIGDSGIISNEEGRFRVEETIHLLGGRIAHVGYMESGTLRLGDSVNLEVDAQRRANIAKNHSGTHLLHRALREVLGEHVQQKGSYVDDQKLRFDFVHFSAMTAEEIAEVERLVNERIAADVPVATALMSQEDAKKTGAMALFNEKYGDEVRVVSMGDYSMELCGGCHVSHTGQIQAMKIVSESGSAAGIRRIEALTGPAVFAYYQKEEELLNQVSALLKTSNKDLLDRISHLQEELKSLESELESMKAAAAKEALGNVDDAVVEIAGYKFLAQSLTDVDMNGLRDLGDQLKEKLGEGLVLLASESEGKVVLMATATEAAQKAGAHAGNLIKQIAPLVGGGGGGRPNMAQAGGKNPAGIAEALKKAAEVFAEQVK